MSVRDTPATGSGISHHGIAWDHELSAHSAQVEHLRSHLSL